MHRIWKLPTGVALAVSAFACNAILNIGDLPATTDLNNLSEGGTVNLAPTHAAASIAFTDQDPAQGSIVTHLAIGKATNEDDLDQYDVYWGSDATAKLTGVAAIANLPKTGSDLTFDLASAPPSGANYVIAFTSKSGTEMTRGPSATVVDNYAKYVDVSATQSANSGYFPSVAIDGVNSKLLIATQVGADAADSGQSTSKIGLFRCELDGTSCAFVDISAGSTGLESPSLTIDVTNGKLLVAAEDSSNQQPVVLHCEVADANGTTCVKTSLVDGSHGPGDGVAPLPLIDATHNSLDVVASNGLSGKLTLFRCQPDGTLCTYHDLSTGQGALSGNAHSATIDTQNSKLLIAVKNGAQGGNLGLYSCQLDGTSCSYIDVSVGLTSGPGSSTSLVIDPTKNSLDIATDGQPSGSGIKNVVVHCNVDGSACQVSTSGNSSVAQSVRYSLVVDALHSTLLSAYSTDTGETSVDRCDQSGKNCTTVSLAAGQPENSGVDVSAVIDRVNAKLLVAATNASNSQKPGLFAIGLW